MNAAATKTTVPLKMLILLISPLSQRVVSYATVTVVVTATTTVTTSNSTAVSTSLAPGLPLFPTPILLLQKSQQQRCQQLLVLLLK